MLRRQRRSALTGGSKAKCLDSCMLLSMYPVLIQGKEVRFDYVDMDGEVVHSKTGKSRKD
jgi:hypothetical protein